MFDFPITEVNVWCPLYCFIMYVALLCSNYHLAIDRAYSINIHSKKQNIAICIVAILIISHCLQGDFFHMLVAVKEYDPTPNAYNYGEPFYVALGIFLNKNYLLFRTVVLGGAFLLFCLTSRRFGIPVYNAALILLASYIVLFAYSRATLAMAVYFFGLSFLCRPRRNAKWLWYLVGIAIILLSRVFHNSAIIMVIATLAIVIPYNKITVFGAIIMTPLLLSVFQDYFLSIMQSGGLGEDITTKFDTYVELEREGLGLSGYIINTLMYCSFYIPLAIISFCLYKLNFKIQNDILRLYKVMILLMYISLLFIFMGDAFSVYVYRILYMTMIPIILITYRLYKNGNINKKRFLLCIRPGIYFNLVKYLYSVYCLIVV